MKNLLNIVSSFIRDEEGLTMVEYALAGSLIAVVAITGFTATGTGTEATAQAISAKLQAAPAAP